MNKFRLAASLLTLTIGLTFAGCGAKQPAKAAGTSSAPSDIQAIKDRGVLKVGVKVDVPKFGYKDPKTSKIDGFEIDLARAIAKKILGSEDKIDLQAVTAKTRGPLLDSDQVDMVAATFTITDERKKSYNFSDPYYVDGVKLMVKKSSGIKSLKDLNNKKIGVAQTSTSKQAITDEANKLGVKVNFADFATYPEIKAALMSGRVDAFSVDGSILAGYLDDSTVILDEKFSPQSYGIASKKGNDGLAKVINDTINDMKKSGDLDKLISKWGIK